LRLSIFRPSREFFSSSVKSGGDIQQMFTM
jgi:hypothetical protein